VERYKAGGAFFAPQRSGVWPARPDPPDDIGPQKIGDALARIPVESPVLDWGKAPGKNLAIGDRGLVISEDPPATINLIKSVQRSD